MRWFVLVAVFALPPAARAEALSPEAQLCLLHLRPAEKARAAAALGPFENLPLYRTEIDVDPQARRVTGRLRLSYRSSTPLSSLELRVTPNAFGEHETLRDASVNDHPADLGHQGAIYTVKIDPPSASVELSLAFEATVPRAPADSSSLIMDPATANHSDHGAFMASPDLVSLIGVLPQVPARDENGATIGGPNGMGDLGLYQPALVLASITVPAGWKAHATGTPLGEVPEPNGKVRFSFGAAAVRDFPLLVSRGYEVATAKLDDVVIESHYAQRDEKIGKRVLADAVAAMDALQKRLGPLPYVRFKVVEAPLTGGAGGMEFPGLITVATALYRGVANPLGALGVGDGQMQMLQAMMEAQGMGAALQLPNLSPMFEQILEFTVDHEVGHQYFAGLIGSDPIRDPVVDETLAQYSALLVFEWRHGRAAAEQLEKTQVVGAYQLYRMMGGEDGAADRPTGEFHTGTEYAALVYGKAPMLHAAERKLLGDAAFLAGMRAYVDAYRFKWACSDCFTRTLASTRPQKADALRALRRHWWQEAHGDEDLGGADVNALLGQVSGQKLDPATQEMIEKLLPQLLGP